MKRSKGERVRLDHALARMRAALDAIDSAGVLLVDLPIGQETSQAIATTALEIATIIARHDAYMIAEGEQALDPPPPLKPSCATCGRLHGDGWNPRHPFRPVLRVDPGVRRDAVPDAWRCECGINVATERAECPACLAVRPEPEPSRVTPKFACRSCKRPMRHGGYDGECCDCSSSKDL